MENITNSSDSEQNTISSNLEKSHRRGKIAGGIFIIIIGSLFLARELGVDLPQCLFTWKMFLIGAGITIGIKHNFKHAMWFFLILIGGTFLLGDLYPDMIIKRVMWPILIIIIGVFTILKPRRKHKNIFFKHDRNGHWESSSKKTCYINNVVATDEDHIDSTTFFGAVGKKIISKNFKGGDIVIVFSGNEINLMQADLANDATLEITTVFGGAKILAPANWEIKSEIVCVCGSVEDKRPIIQGGNESSKILILKGTVFCGGIEIKSY